MIAHIQRNESGYIAEFKREFNHPAYKVWAMLIDNKRLKEWFPELEVKELGTGGMILFDMQDGTYEEMPILDYVEGKVLEFVWGEDKVRFEIHADDSDETSTLLLSEKITFLTDHTPKDLAGWHVCLDAIETLLNGRALTESKEEWDHWYPQYVEALKPFR